MLFRTPRLLLLLSLCLLFSCSSTNKEKVNRKFTLQEFLQAHRISDAGLSPDGKSVFYISNKENYPSIWSTPSSALRPTKIVDIGRPIKNLYVAPDGEHLFFTADRDGNENYQIYSFHLKTGQQFKLTQKNDRRYYFCGWSNDGSLYSFSSNHRKVQFFDIYQGSAQAAYKGSPQHKSLIKTDHVNLCGNFAPNNKKYAFVRMFGNSHQKIIVADLINNHYKEVTPRDQKAIFGGVAWSKLGSHLYVLTDYKSDMQYLGKIDLQSSKIKAISHEPFEVESFDLSASGNLSFYNVNKYGYSFPKFYSGEFEAHLKRELGPGIVKIHGISNDDQSFLYSKEDPKSPKELFIWEESQPSTRVTNANQSPVPKSQMAQFQIKKFHSRDGLEISSLYLSPQNLGPKKIPAIILIHGGPESQSRPTYSGLSQYLVNQGFAVIMPNFRGSTGYGKRFRKLVYGDWGGKHIDDIVATYEHLKSLPEVDPNKISVVGGSFGGFSVLSAITQHPDKFFAAVDIFGPSNLFTFVNSVPEHWKPLVKTLVGDPTKNRKMFYERSPIFHIHKIKTPLLVIQGKHDPRVVKAESDKIVEALKKRGKTVDYLLFKDEGHGFSKNKNKFTAYGRIISFLKKNM